MDWSELCKFNNIKNIIIKDDINYEKNKEKNIEKNKFDINTIISSINSDKIIKNLTSDILLKKMYFLSNNLNKYYFNYSNIKKENIIIIVNSILEMNNILKNRLNMKTIEINLDNLNKNSIPRSSYKFCNFKDACKYNYEKKSCKGCYAHHYVYNLLEFDLNILLYYLDNLEECNIFNNKELSKSLTTVNYVIKHMYDELNSILLYIKKEDNIEKYHINNKKNVNRKKRNINI